MELFKSVFGCLEVWVCYAVFVVLPFCANLMLNHQAHVLGFIVFTALYFCTGTVLAYRFEKNRNWRSHR